MSIFFPFPIANLLLCNIINADILFFLDTFIDFIHFNFPIFVGVGISSLIIGT